MIENRLKKNYKNLKQWSERNKIEAYRLYDRDIPEYPFIIDIYADNTVIYVRSNQLDDQTKLAEKTKKTIETINTLFPETAIIVKSRKQQKGKEQYSSQKSQTDLIPLYENGAQYLVNLYDYIDTGLFLDHRPLRSWIQKQSSGLHFLNLFCYTGTVSVAAALGGARTTTNVDISPTYIKWAKQNFNLNKISSPSHRFIEENVLSFLKKAPLQSKRYNLIFLDPPTFSNSKKMETIFEVEKEQDFLVKSCMKILTDDGLLYFSCNKRNFKLSTFLQNRFAIKDVTTPSIPIDYRDKKIHKCFEIRHKNLS
ncbi:class I SAM-dependent methyltransferase [Bdellovibrionales bacterium]|nr:class I SAM-dependent methyltransferase [Bdellovibrionales bacterium]